MQTADVTLPRLEPELTRWFSEAVVRESSSFKQGTGLEVCYAVTLRQAGQLPHAVQALLAVEGVTGVELKRV
jgi:hypothetical protein